MRSYLKQLRQIAEGYSNLLLDRHKEVALNRAIICLECPLYVEGYCSKTKEVDGITGCGCLISSKTRCMSCECPRKLWLKNEDI
jgi:hypothetical protein